MSFFIPIDRTSISYRPNYLGPYIVPCKKTYTQTNHITTVGTEIQNGKVIGVDKVHYLGPIQESKEYKELYPDKPQHIFQYRNIRIQCDNCFETMELEETSLYQFYDSFHNDHYDDGKSRKCVWCDNLLNLEFEELDRPILEEYASRNNSRK